MPAPHVTIEPKFVEFGLPPEAARAMWEAQRCRCALTGLLLEDTELTRPTVVLIDQDKPPSLRNVHIVCELVARVGVAAAEMKATIMKMDATRGRMRATVKPYTKHDEQGNLVSSTMETNYPPEVFCIAVMEWLVEKKWSLPLDVVRRGAQLDITLDTYRMTLIESDDAVMGVRCWDYERDKGKKRQMAIEMSLENPAAFEKIVECISEGIDRALDLYYSD